MDATRADGGPMAGAAYAGLALACVCGAAIVCAPGQIGVGALAVGACALAAPRHRMAALEPLAGLAFMAFMFGPAGAGGFALMHVLVVAPVAIGLRRVRPATALTVAVGVGAMASVLSAVFLTGLAPTRWAAFAPMAPAFALAAPGMALRAMATASLGPVRADAQRLNALGPLLVALVIGAGTGGLRGAAIGWAAGQLAIPCAMLLISGRRPALTLHALGTLTAGFVSTLAAGAALAFAGASPLAVAPAIVIGLAVYALAMRVHAPAGARRLARFGRGLSPSRTAPASKPAPAPV